MPRFIAIPVPQGDAFYFERDDFSVLVDGGRSRSGFARMFQNVTRADDSTYLVCTHNDADHGNGILGFLEAGLRCQEVWLPGRWLAILPKVLGPFVEVFVQLAHDVGHRSMTSETDNPPPGLSPLEAYEGTARGSFEAHPKGNDELRVGEDGWPESYLPLLEQAEPWEIAPWVPLWPLEDRQFFSYLHYRKLGAAGLQLLWSAIEAASRIRAIAIESFHRGIPVRWFEFDVDKPSDDVPANVPALQALNARAVVRICPLVGPLLSALALTVSNKESLVFWSPPTEEHPGVLFTADSDLEGVRLPCQLRNAIATAPHHGSEANKNAYAAVAAAAQHDSPSITWVRSDGRNTTRPGSSYLGLGSQRLCTICRPRQGSSTRKQAVRLFSRGGVWTRHRATVKCSCQ